MRDKPHSESLLSASLHDSFVHVQMRLFPLLEDEFGELDEDHRQFVALYQQVEPLFPHGFFAWPRPFRTLQNLAGGVKRRERAAGGGRAASASPRP